MKNQNREFIVHTSNYDVQVTGTKFNVKAYQAEDEIATTLEDGQVVIKTNSEGMQLENNIILKPGEQAVFSKTNRTFKVASVETKWFTSWRNNKLIFVNMDLEELVILLERKYGVNIEIKNPEIIHLHFDGTLKDESIIEFLEILKKTLPINYKIVGQKIEITNKS